MRRSLAPEGRRGMPKVLIVEDSRFNGAVLKREIESRLEFEVEWVRSFRQALAALDRDGPDFCIALCDLDLPDAPHGEIVTAVLSHNVPAIVFTGEIDERVRLEMRTRRVIDYVLKEGAHNVDYLISLVRRIHQNSSIRVLVVDDSPSSREHLVDLLKLYRYQVLEATSGEAALAMLKTQPGIKMVITDYSMPGMDGFELITRIRTHHRKEEMAIIGISAYGDNMLSARFIKHGANDFLNKPFHPEEFHCRVSQNIEMVEYVTQIKDASNRDYLTKLFNRRYFMDMAEKLYANARRGNLDLIVAMLDIDHFKRVNDSYGHAAGDEVLRQVAAVLQRNFRASDLVARLGGEEFCIVASNMDRSQVIKKFEMLRRAIQELAIEFEGQTILITLSMGITGNFGRDFGTMLQEADELLYRAKESGRNRICFQGLKRAVAAA